MKYSYLETVLPFLWRSMEEIIHDWSSFPDNSTTIQVILNKCIIINSFRVGTYKVTNKVKFCLTGTVKSNIFAGASISSQFLPGIQVKFDSDKIMSREYWWDKIWLKSWQRHWFEQKIDWDNNLSKIFNWIHWDNEHWNWSR